MPTTSDCLPYARQCSHIFLLILVTILWGRQCYPYIHLKKCIHSTFGYINVNKTVYKKKFECNHRAYLENNKFKIVSIFLNKRSVFVFRYNASGIIILEVLLFILLFYHYFYYYIIVIFSGTIISSIISKKRNTSSLC